MPIRRKNHVGLTYGRLTVLSELPEFIDAAGQKRRQVRCICSCGASTDVYPANLVKGVTASCGCLSSELKLERSVTHGMAWAVPEYSVWAGMRNRCTNPQDPNWPRYGGRGIVICKEWDNFEVFFSDMGSRPSLNHSINRKNNNGNYEPKNCSWATPKEQARNRRSNSLTAEKVKFIRENAGFMTQVKIAEIVGTSQAHVSRVILNQSWVD